MRTKTLSVEEKCDRAASKYYRRETPYCEAAAYLVHDCNGWEILDWAHIESRRNRRLRYEPMNKLILCRNAHRYYTDRPYEWKRLVRNHFPLRWRFVEEHRNEYMKPDYELWIERFSGKQMIP